MKVWKRMACSLLVCLMVFAMIPTAWAKTVAGSQTVDTVFFYVTNSEGQQILVSQIPVDEMEADLAAGVVDNTLHNYSVLDNYITPLHQEAQGFTVPELVAYAQKKSTVAALRALPLTFQGSDKIAFWEMDQTGYDETDTYTWDELYGVTRYNFPLLYRYWNYQTQQYDDPDGTMTGEQVIDYIFENGEPEIFLLSVSAFSQRYMITTEKYSAGDYNMENYWNDQGLLDSARTLRVMVGMTKDELYNAIPTAQNTRYWIQSVNLDMASRPKIQALENVAAPTGVMYQGLDGYYYVTLHCDTQGAQIYYNHNFGSSSYMPTAAYEETLRIPADYVKNGVFTLTARAVKDGCTDEGVVTLRLTSSGTVEGWHNPFSDVSSDDWYYDAVVYAVENGLYEGTSATTFAPGDTMSRAMFVTVMSRLVGADVSGYTSPRFTDVPALAWYSPYVNWAADAGIVIGTGGGMFSPNADISLESMILVLYRHSGETAPANAAVPGGVGTVSAWAEEAMRWAAGRGLFTGVSGSLTAGSGATRAQVAAILMNYDG